MDEQQSEQRQTQSNKRKAGDLLGQTSLLADQEIQVPDLKKRRPEDAVIGGAGQSHLGSDNEHNFTVNQVLCYSHIWPVTAGSPGSVKVDTLSNILTLTDARGVPLQKISQVDFGTIHHVEYSNDISTISLWRPLEADGTTSLVLKLEGYTEVKKLIVYLGRHCPSIRASRIRRSVEHS